MYRWHIIVLLLFFTSIALMGAGKTHTSSNHLVTVTPHIGAGLHLPRAIDNASSNTNLSTTPQNQIKVAPVSSTPPATVPSVPRRQATTVSAHYTVRGNTIYDSSDKAHTFHGLNKPSLEWSSGGEHMSLADYQIMASWKANVVRLPLSEKYWIQDADHYKSTVAQQVSWITSLGMDVILDLHWSDGGSIDKPADQYSMADQDSRVFWSDVARMYKGNPNVLFELYNEPRNITWDVWQNGGSIPDAQGNMFTAVGMQRLYDDVRAAGAKNVVIIGGIDWAYDLSGVATHRIVGTNIAYATHVYDFYGKTTVVDWEASFGALAKTDPVIITEFGTFNCSTTLYSSLLAYAKTSSLSWVGWAWYPGGCSFPSLITDWSGTPTVAGKIVMEAM